MARATIEYDGDTLKLSGVVDFDSVPDLMRATDSLSRSGFSAVNAAALEKIDSAGIAYLLWLKKHHGSSNGPLSIISASGQLERLLAVTGFGDLLEKGGGSRGSALGSRQS
jgi:anti-anti-sigma factor